MSGNSAIRFRIAIIGGGIGGLIFAVAIHQLCQNVKVDLYESSAQFGEIGAGIGLWPRPWEVLQYLGLEEELRLVASGTSGKEDGIFHYRKSDQPEGFFFLESTSRGEFLTFHRADFQAVLSRHLPPTCDLHFSKRLTSYKSSPSGELILEFADSSRANCDIVVGCDGIKSVTRNVMYASLAEKAEQVGDNANALRYHSEAAPVFTGWIAYRGLIRRERLQEISPDHPVLTRRLMCFGKNKHLVLYSVSGGRLINVVAFVMLPDLEGTTFDGPWVRQATKDELFAAFSTWEPAIKEILSCLEEVSHWAINSVPNLSTYVDSQTALIGDAAHAMSPHQGSGAGQAAEDGLILATLLGHPSVTLETLPRALQIYDQIRRPFSQQILQRSHVMGLHYEFLLPEFDNITEEASASSAITLAQLEKIGVSVGDLWSWASTTSIMGDRARALELLQAGIQP